MAGAGAVELEVRTWIVRLVSPAASGAEFAVLVNYRAAGDRPWRSFTLVPKPGQLVSELRKHAHVAAQMVHAGKAEQQGTVEIRADVDELPQPFGAA